MNSTHGNVSHDSHQPFRTDLRVCILSYIVLCIALTIGQPSLVLIHRIYPLLTKSTFDASLRPFSIYQCTTYRMRYSFIACVLCLIWMNKLCSAQISTTHTKLQEMVNTIAIDFFPEFSSFPLWLYFCRLFLANNKTSPHISQNW